MQLFPNHLATGLFIISFPSICRKLSCRNVYKSCCCIDILILSLYPNVVLANELYVWVSILTMWSSKIGSSSMLKMSVIFRYFAPRIPKIVEMQRSTRWVSFSWYNRMIEIYYQMLVLLLPNIALCLTCPFNRNILYAARTQIHVRYHRNHRMCNLTVIPFPRKSSNRPYWSMMRIVKSEMLHVMIDK